MPCAQAVMPELVLVPLCRPFPHFLLPIARATLQRNLQCPQQSAINSDRYKNAVTTERCTSVRVHASEFVWFTIECQLSVASRRRTAV